MVFDFFKINFFPRYSFYISIILVNFFDIHSIFVVTSRTMDNIFEFYLLVEKNK